MNNFSQLSALIGRKYREIDRLERKKSQIWADLLELEVLARAVHFQDADVAEWAESARLGVPEVEGRGI